MANHDAVLCSTDPTLCTFDAQFCICTGGFPCFDPANIQGQWSDSSTLVGTFGSGAAWSNTSNAKVYNDGLYASVTIPPMQPLACDSGGGNIWFPSEGIELTQLGLAIPVGATIYGFMYAISGRHSSGDDCSGLVGNFGLKSKEGTRYYQADPATGWCEFSTAPIPPYVFIQPWGSSFPGESTDCATLGTTNPMAGNGVGGYLSCQGGLNTYESKTDDAYWSGQVLGKTWTREDVIDPDFGVHLIVTNTNNAQSIVLQLDYFTVCVYYTEGQAFMKETQASFQPELSRLSTSLIGVGSGEGDSVH